MNKRTLIFLGGVLGLTVSLFFGGCGADGKYAELEQRVERIEKIVGDENTSKSVENVDNENAKYRNATEINLFFDYKGVGKHGVQYQLLLRDDHCTLYCFFELKKQSKESDISYADLQNRTDFSKDTYNEILDMICSQKLEVYENEPVTYEAVPCVVSLYLGPQEGCVYFKPLDNMDEIIAKFESLRDMEK